MNIDFDKFTVQLGIRDFVSFAQSSYPTTTLQAPGNWRTAIGQEWHKQLWQETEDAYGEQARSEVSLKGDITHKGWTFSLSGRIDQIIIDEDDNEILIREIKTTQQVLPLPVEDLQTKYPDYFEQLACYELLFPDELRVKGRSLSAELLMLHIDTGIRQIVHLPDSPENVLQQRLEIWVDFLEGKRRSKTRVEHLVIPEAFETFREDQIPIRKCLFDFYNNRFPNGASPANDAIQPFIALQAATGFGKTSIAIEWALQGIKKGIYDRVIYLTGKNTGQKQAVDELSRFRTMSEGIRFFQIRNRATLEGACPHLTCPCNTGELQTSEVLNSSIPSHKIDELLFDGSPNLGTLSNVASDYRVCPKVLSQAAMAATEFWIADYNYIFSPQANQMIESIPGFDSKRTLLLIDEAHNLHDRVCSNYSIQFSSWKAEQILSAMRQLRIPASISGSIHELKRFAESLTQKKELNTTERYHLEDLLQSCSETILQNGGRFSKLPESALEYIWELMPAYKILKDKDLDTITWSSSHQALDITTIDASRLIRTTLNQYTSTLFMSATLPPPEVFEHQMKINEDSVLRLGAFSEWRQHCYTVAIDTRVNTTYKKREGSYRKTAHSAIQLQSTTINPLLLFFPSYKYAETIAEYIRVMEPGVEVFTMPRGLSPEDQIEAIQYAVQTNRFLCLPLGSGLSEGIDFLGGKIDTVMIVSPALPEVNLIQQSKSDRFSDPNKGFQYTYLIPGMTKVNQALGRIVRSPDHRARVLLHCERFNYPGYRTLLTDEYRNATILSTNTEFENWIVR